MSVSLRAVTLALTLAVPSVLPLPPAAAQAQDYPSRPVKIVVPFGAGGPADVYARVLAQHLSEALKQPFVVEDRPGAGSLIGTDAVAKSPPDGYTLLAMSNTHTTNESLIPNKPFQLMRDFVPVAGINYSDLVMVVHPSVPAKDLKEFIAYAKSKPGELTFVSTGNGTPGHLNGELFMRLTGIKAIHVPYRVVSQGVTDLVASRVSFWIAPIPTLLPQIQSGQVRPLAVAGETRSSDLPGIPTIKESGIGDFDASTTYGLFAPAGTPREIVDRLYAEVKRALEIETVQQKMRVAGVEPKIGTPADVKAMLDAKIPQWADVIKNAGITIDNR
jgi:tripartite-type tricarboxylate transporter receptor subunit TctC